MPTDDRKCDSSDSEDFFRELHDAPAPPQSGAFTRAFGTDAEPEPSDSSPFDNSASRPLNAPAAPSIGSGAFTKEFGGGTFAPVEPTRQIAPRSDFPPAAPPSSGAFTQLFGPASIPAEASAQTDVTRKMSPESIAANPFAAPAPRSNTPKPSSFTEVFSSSSVAAPATPSRSSGSSFSPKSASDSFDFPAQPAPERAATPKAGAFTQLFTGSLPPMTSAAPEPPKPASDFPWAQPSGPSMPAAAPAPAPMAAHAAAASGSDATRLFHPPAEPTPAVPAASAGPGAYTRVVSGAQLRGFENFQSPAAAPSAPPAFQWSTAPTPNLAAPIPQAAPAAYAPPAAPAWPQAPPPISLPQAAPAPAPPTSPLVKYLPLILGFNALLLIAILLVLFFALKK